MKYDYECKNCKDGGTVVWDAYATWDVETQEHELDSSFDYCECNECGDTDIKEIEIKEESE